jgi:hypothetical protein
VTSHQDVGQRWYPEVLAKALKGQRDFLIWYALPFRLIWIHNYIHEVHSVLSYFPNFEVK